MKGRFMRLQPFAATAGEGSFTERSSLALRGVPPTFVTALAVAVLAAALLSGPTGISAPQAYPGSRGLASLSLAAQGPIASALGRTDTSYWVRGGRAQNPAQHLRMTFSTTGARVSNGRAVLSLSLAAVGTPQRLRALRPTMATMHANRVSYTHPGVTEWYANGPLGLEQGFDVDRRPPSDAGRLALSVSVATSLHARAAATGIVFSGHGPALRYAGLVATDARGHRLRAWMAIGHGRVLLLVADRGAQYPIRIDPFVQLAELTEAGSPLDALGYSAAVSGTTAVVGAPVHQVGSQTNQGAVMVFSEPASGWASASSPTAVLTASDGASNDELGYTVAISGNTIVSGAPAHAVNGHAGQGAAYVFVEPATGWKSATQTAELTASDGAAHDTGSYLPVSISGNTIVYGAWQHQVGSNAGQGAVYVFVEPSTGWKNATQTTEVTASDGAASNEFGLETSVSGSTLAIYSTKAVYVFQGSGSSWSQKAELTTPAGAIQGDGGGQLAVSSNAVAMGAVYQQVGSNGDQGVVYVFQEPGSGWATTSTPSATLTASDGNAGADLGFSVSMSGGQIASGAPGQTENGIPSQGAIYVFAEPSTGWASGGQSAEVTESPGGSDELGYSVGVSASTIVSGTRAHQRGAFVFSSNPNGGGGGGSGKPVNIKPPKITGTPTVGKKLSCSNGSWSNSPTKFGYQWDRSGTPIPGASHSTYTVQKLDEGLTLTCSVTASNGSGSSSATGTTSQGVKIAVPRVHECPAATGRLDGTKLGLVKLGMTRKQARHAYKHSSNRGKKYEDFFCLTPIGVRVGYASPKLVKTLPEKDRKKYQDRVIWASTSSAFYAIKKIRASATVAAAGRKLKLTKPFRIGRNDWYLARNGSATIVLKARRGIVEEIGIGSRALTSTHKEQANFLHSFS